MKKSILIIDNDQLLNKINKRILIAAGIVNELHIVANGKDALDHLRTRLIKNKPMPDMIILDLHLPVMNGFHFLNEFQTFDFAGKNNIELVVFTSSNSLADRQKAFAKGIKHYLHKPYLLRAIINIINMQNQNSSDFTVREDQPKHRLR
jgi:CheY-like chemotaxis protein